MKLSCNGCRVLRRGCDPDCPIRRCLINNNWIINSSSPHSQSNATLFLAKFYGRTGLLNLLTAAPPHLQPAVFKSLLYEACGRIVNPVFGSTGLLSTGSWHLCEATVKAVLNGVPIQQALDGAISLHLQSCDIRHVAKSRKSCSSGRTRRFKSRAGELMKPKVDDSVSHDSGFGVSDHKSNDVVEADSNSRSVDEELELELTLRWGPSKRI